MNVKATRKRLGLTQEQFARLLGISAPTVQRWEYGKTKPTLFHADIINQTNQHLSMIEKIEEKEKLSIGEIINNSLIGEGIAFGLYQFLKIIFDERM